MNDDQFNLQRFVEAQTPVFDAVLAELHQGDKQTHWMWFVFPQVKGLGSSPMAERYAIQSLDEAVAYLQHPVLGVRLSQCVSILLALEGKSASEIFGYPDDMKLQSSMTLFAIAVDKLNLDDNVYRQMLRKYFAGVADMATELILEQTDKYD